MSERFQALKKAREEERYFPTDFWGASQPKCPHCGKECGISDNEWWRLYEEGEHEVECPHCEGEFTVSTSVSYSFDTSQQEDADDEEASKGAAA
jgi:DNA-directed RNA polymerase subunit RPC12/RpoP